MNTFMKSIADSDRVVLKLNEYRMSRDNLQRKVLEQAVIVKSTKAFVQQLEMKLSR